MTGPGWIKFRNCRARSACLAVSSSIKSRPARRLISQFGGLRVRCEQRPETLGIAARHAALGRHAVGPDVAPGGGEASSVAGHVVEVNETGIKFGFRAQIQPGKRAK